MPCNIWYSNATNVLIQSQHTTVISRNMLTGVIMVVSQPLVQMLEGLLKKTMSTQYTLTHHFSGLPRLPQMSHQLPSVYLSVWPRTLPTLLYKVFPNVFAIFKDMIQRITTRNEFSRICLCPETLRFPPFSHLYILILVEDMRFECWNGDYSWRSTIISEYKDRPLDDCF